jgi:hypothetical protein
MTLLKALADQGLELAPPEPIHGEEEISCSLPSAPAHARRAAEVGVDHRGRIPGPGPIGRLKGVHATWNNRRVG